MSVPKYLFSIDPEAIEDDYIIHTQSPRFIAVVNEYTEELAEELRNNQNSTQFHSLTNSFEGVEYLISVYEFWEKVELSQSFADKMAKIMSEIGDAYYEHLEDLYDEFDDDFEDDYE